MKEVRAGTQRHELQERPQKTASYCLVLCATLSLLLYNPGPPAWRWHYPQWSGPTHINHQLRKYPPHLLAYRKILCSHFSIEFLLCHYKKLTRPIVFLWECLWGLFGFYVHECFAYMYVCHYVCTWCLQRSEDGIRPWNWSYKWLWDSLYMLRF